MLLLLKSGTQQIKRPPVYHSRKHNLNSQDLLFFKVIQDVSFFALFDIPDLTVIFFSDDGRTHEPKPDYHSPYPPPCSSHLNLKPVFTAFEWALEYDNTSVPHNC